jgi:hypothetical protein
MSRIRQRKFLWCIIFNNQYLKKDTTPASKENRFLRLSAMQAAFDASKTLHLQSREERQEVTQESRCKARIRIFTLWLQIRSSFY